MPIEREITSATCMLAISRPILFTVTNKKCVVANFSNNIRRNRLFSDAQIYMLAVMLSFFCFTL
jgi:hypothetical protein